MTNDTENGGGFGWGLLVGLALGFVAGAVLASGPGREQMATLRARTVELTGTARRVARDLDHPIGRAINDGIAAASRRRQELERTARGRWQQPKDVTEEAQPDA